MGDTGCMCGSGGHPRECKTHPLAYVQHIEDLDLEARLQDLEDAASKHDLHRSLGDTLAIQSECEKAKNKAVGILARAHARERALRAALEKADAMAEELSAEFVHSCGPHCRLCALGPSSRLVALRAYRDARGKVE